MADEKRTILYEVIIQTESANKAIDDLGKAQEQTAKSTKKVTQSMEELEEIANKEAKTIQELREQNSALNKLRNQADITTEAGIKKLNEYNSKLDRNNILIKSNVDAYAKQKIGIGDYSGALSQFFPRLTQSAEGFGAMTKASMGFIATPIGAIIIALKLAFDALTSAFKGSEEGQNKLTMITTTATAVWTKFKDLVSTVGEALVAVAENPKQAFQDLVDFIQQNLINRFKALVVVAEGFRNMDFKQVANGLLQLGTGVEDVIGKVSNLGSEIADTIATGVKQGQELARLQTKLREDQRKFELDEARTALQVAELKQKSATSQGEERLKFAKQAIALEEDISRRRVQLAEDEFVIAQKTAEIGKNTIEDNNALIEAERKVLEARKVRFEKTNEFATQIAGVEQQIEAQRKAKEDKEKADQEKRDADEAKRIEAKAQKELQAQQQLDQLRAQQLIDAEQDLDKKLELEIQYQELLLQQRLIGIEEGSVQEQLLIEQTQDQVNQIYNKYAEQRTNKEKEENEKRKQLDKAVVDAKKKQAGELVGALAQAGQQGLVSQKAVTLAQIGLDTAEAISSLTSASEANPANSVTFGGAGIAQFVAGLVRIFANIASAKKFIGFAEGGLTGQRIGFNDGVPIRRSNGDNMLATVKTGEVILNQRHQALLGGDETFRRIGVRGFAEGGRTTIQGFAEGGITMNRTNGLSWVEKLLQRVRPANEINTQPVLILEDFEYRYGQTIEVRQQSKVM